MSSSLSSLVGNLTEGIHNDKYKDCKYNKKYLKEFNENYIERCTNIYESCNADINKFILLLRK